MVYTFARPKAVITEDISLTFDTSVTKDGTDFYLRLFIDGLTPTPYSVTGISADAASDTLTTSQSLSKVRINDVVSGTDIPLGSHVTAIDLEAGTITISEVTTDAITAASLTFTPPAVDATLFKFKIETVVTGQKGNLSYRITPITFDGSKVYDVDGTGTDDADNNLPFVSDNRVRAFSTQSLVLDDFLLAARVNRD